MAGNGVALIGAWACAFAAYLVFAGDVNFVEAVAGAIGATAATFWWVGVSRLSNSRFAFDRPSLAAAGRACRDLPRATFRIAAVLLRAIARPIEGTVERRFYAHGRKADPLDSGRRALGVLAASLAPDSFVLRTPIDRDEVIVHDLVRTASSPDPRWPL